MKVQCIDNTGTTELGLNGIYHVTDQSSHTYTFLETGDNRYEKKRFIPVKDDTETKEGKKYDSGKLRYDLVPAIAEQELTKVLTFGANKYGAENWRLVDGHERRYYAALRRHVNAWRLGEKLDQESGLHHLAHAMCCVLFLLTTELEDKKDA